ncbi:hypothetical protein IP90_00962 [Luteimonas cucumeris]|uniref:Uncharacterized protein n=1 Tax=Luteimonas cucumeris TaxID=985012 RepID=A0A562LBJ0_9GAMM|nr:hypothetical protein IP90_00962 [Luteimonas cucumeris]
MAGQGTFTYKRYMRDGTVALLTGVVNAPKRVRTGKTAKDRKRGGRS